jgi:hypothetical protein
MWVRDRLDGLWEDEDFAGWYPRDGRPGLSPAQLATVSVLRFLLDLFDRGAAEAVRCRIGFKYALGLDQALRSPVRHRGHGLRARPRPRHAPLPLPGQPKAHLQHVLTAIAGRMCLSHERP